MSIRKILLPLQAVTTAAAAFATAAMIARSWSAHVAVLHITADRERESAARSLFGTLTAEHDLPVADARPNADNPTASFAAVKGREADVVAYQARLADLIVVPHPASDKEVSSSDALHAVLFDSAKPVLIAPRTAASAVLAAFPWLKRAQSIRILWSDDYQRRGPLAPDLEQYLAAHDITVDQAPFSAINNVVRRRAAGSGRQFCL
jgi:hypothetical protein